MSATIINIRQRRTVSPKTAAPEMPVYGRSNHTDPLERALMFGVVDIEDLALRVGRELTVGERAAVLAFHVRFRFLLDA